MSYIKDNDRLIGRILPARIFKVHNDSCFLHLLDPETGEQLAIGKLNQEDSQAWNQKALLEKISGYQVGSTLSGVYVYNHLREEGEHRYYVNERWGANDPWENLALKPEDIVTGKIAREVRSQDDIVGYLIQLDVGKPTLVSPSGILEEDETRPQPDIPVFLPAEEIPWADGTIHDVPYDRSVGRMPLTVGEPIQAEVQEIRTPPHYPPVSVLRLLHHRDPNSEKTFSIDRKVTDLRLQLFLQGKKPQGQQQRQEQEEAQEPVANQRPYAGKRFLLVDDTQEVLNSQAELLRMMGAKVHTVHVRHGKFPDAVTETADILKKNRGKEPFDLVLIDNNLPGKDLGQSLFYRVKARVGENPARFAFFTADRGHIPQEPTQKSLRENGAVGFLQRPLTHPDLQRLLSGEEVWAEPKPEAEADSGLQYLPTTGAAMTVPEMLEQVARQPGIRFAMLFRASRQTTSMLMEGNTPFGEEDLSEVIEKSELRQLIEGKRSSITTKRPESSEDDDGNEILRKTSERSHWQILEMGATRWIFGVGHEADQNIGAQLPLWAAALGAAMDSQDWRNWSHHISNFVQLGLAHQGLSHEVMHLQQESSNLLSLLKHEIEQMQPDTTLTREHIGKLLKRVMGLKDASAKLLNFSQHQLHGQALRHELVYLPDVARLIERIAYHELGEYEVTLHMNQPPKLALPIPNAALVLPIINLVLNAAKHHYRQENKRVELLFDVDISAKEPTLVIDVRDNGPGLSLSATETLFQPGYSQATDVDKRHGIGLWMSRQLLEDVGGTLELAENFRGLGCCFRIRLPMNLGQRTMEKKTLLLIDDSPTFRETVATFGQGGLEQFGVQQRICQTGTVDTGTPPHHEVDESRVER